MYQNAIGIYIGLDVILDSFYCFFNEILRAEVALAELSFPQLFNPITNKQHVWPMSDTFFVML
jgi:hypothetical protein